MTPARAQVAGAITVYPTTSRLDAGTTVQFTAYVPISPNTVVWLVNGLPGGNSNVGIITATGLYTPPAVIPVNNVFTVSAKSVAFPTSVGNATLTLTRPAPSLWSSSPSSIPVGTYKLTFNGAHLAPDVQMLANGVAVPTTYVSPTNVIVNSTAAQTGTITFAASLPGPGAVTGTNTVNVQVKAAAITVAVAPNSVSVPLGANQTFNATVGGERVRLGESVSDARASAAAGHFADERAVPGAGVIRPDAGVAGAPAADRDERVSRRAVRHARNGDPDAVGQQHGHAAPVDAVQLQRLS